MQIDMIVTRICCIDNNSHYLGIFVIFRDKSSHFHYVLLVLSSFLYSTICTMNVTLIKFQSFSRYEKHKCKDTYTQTTTYNRTLYHSKS